MPKISSAQIIKHKMDLPKRKTSNFIQKMMEEVKILSNISFILGKLNREGFFFQIEDIIGKVLKNEIVFAVQGKPDQNSGRSKPKSPTSTSSTRFPRTPTSSRKTSKSFAV